VKKGFSFVELSIVLVIVGLIMGMALKGKEIITSSEIRKELNKFRKYEAAFTGSLMKTNKPFPAPLPASLTPDALRVWSDNISNKFIEQSYLKREDKLMRYDADNVSVVFFPDISVDSNSKWYELPAASYTAPGESFSVYLEKPANMFVCLLENIIDDKNVDNANGRYIASGNNFTGEEYSDCFSLNGNTGQYAYMFFKH
jgi:prepilin-type N-terminal cleavage/methylation domain-containing protein